MSHLHRELAPISDAAWQEIETEATRALRTFLAARKLVDVTGPLGWEHSALDVGRVQPVTGFPRGSGDIGDVEVGLRTVAPLAELRTSFALQRTELDAVDRGNRAPDLGPVVDASRRLALFEDRAAFHGFPGAGIEGITDATPNEPIKLDEDYEEFPSAVARAVAILRTAGVDGPYGLALGPRCYTGVVETTQKGGYPVLEQVRLITGGPVAWAPGVDGSIVLSIRGGDFELTIGQDVSIGFIAADAERVQLFLEESMTFRAHTPEAAIALIY